MIERFWGKRKPRLHQAPEGQERVGLTADDYNHLKFLQFLREMGNFDRDLPYSERHEGVLQWVEEMLRSPDTAVSRRKRRTPSFFTHDCFELMDNVRLIHHRLCETISSDPRTRVQHYPKDPSGEPVTIFTRRVRAGGGLLRLELLEPEKILRARFSHRPFSYRSQRVSPKDDEIEIRRNGTFILKKFRYVKGVECGFICQLSLDSDRLTRRHQQILPYLAKLFSPCLPRHYLPTLPPI